MSNAIPFNKDYTLTDNLILKEVDGDSTLREFSGTLSRVDKEDYDGDIIVAGAFDAWLKTRNAKQIPMLWSHFRDEPIGYWKDIKMEGKDLVGNGYILNTVQKGKEAIEFIKNDVVSGISIGFVGIEYKFNEGRDGNGFFTPIDFLQVEVREASIVTFPANPAAVVDGGSLKQEGTLSKEKRADLYFKQILEGFAQQ